MHAEEGTRAKAASVISDKFIISLTKVKNSVVLTILFSLLFILVCLFVFKRADVSAYETGDSQHQTLGFHL